MTKKLEVLLWSGIPTALNAAAWTFLSMTILEIDFDIVFVLISAVFAWIFYTKDRLNPKQEDILNKKERVIWYEKHMKTPFKILIPVSIILLCFRYTIIPMALLGTLMAFIYAVPITALKKRIIIKNVFLGKVIFVGILWLLLTVFFPYAYYDSTVTVCNLLQLSAYIFIIIGVQIIVNDIDDLVGDEKENINTIPVIFGVNKAKIVLYFLGVSSLVVGWKLFPLINLITFSVLLIFLIKSYSTTYSVKLKFLNVSLGYIAGFALNPILMNV